MSTIVYVAHSLPGRTRLRVPSRRGDAEYLAQVSWRLGECLGVTGVETNVRTGSLLIRHAVDFAQIAAFAEGHQLFTVQSDNAVQGRTLHQAAENLNWVDTWIGRSSKGDLDLRSVMFVGLLAMSLVQIYRGQILAPASTLLWYAFDLLRSRELAGSQGE